MSLIVDDRFRLDVRISVIERDVVKGKYTVEEIIDKLREAVVIIASGSTVVEAARRTGVSEQTFYL